MTLHGTRYLLPGSEDLQEFIVNDLHTLDLDETLAFYTELQARGPRPEDLALLACNDRFFLLVGLCKRRDAIHPWIFARCREVEADPDGYLDLWSRGHYKSTIVTFAGTIQDVLRDPEITVGIFSYSRSTAQKFLVQIMGELERNEDLKVCFPDVLYWKPASEAPRWSVGAGIVCKRESNPKEATIEAWGLVEGQPTGVHFKKLMFDDLIEKRNVNSPEQIQKATEAWELSDNLGVGAGTRKAYVGTRYLIGDTYETMMDRKSVKVRLYPATHNGRENGIPVYWDQATWDKKRIDQRSTLAAQLLQNPAAGKQATFLAAWLRSYPIRPTTLNVYIMADPSRGRTSRSDRTGMVVLGIDSAGNKYLLDGARHRMKLSERWDMLKMLRDKWVGVPGVQMLNVGYERYGQQSDDEYFQEKMRLMKDQADVFAIAELAWPNEGGNSKKDRVERLQPDMEKGKFFLCPVVKHPELGECYWAFEPEKDDDGKVVDPKVGKIAYTPARGPTNLMRAMEAQGQVYRIPRPITRRDEDGNIYDLTMKFIEEMLIFPFGSHDELPDVTSRIYDMSPAPAVLMETMKPIDVHTYDA